MHRVLPHHILMLQLPHPPLQPRSIRIELGLAVENRLHLLQTPVARLLHKEQDDDAHADVQRGVEEEDVAAHVGDHVGRDEGEEEVKEPLCAHARADADLADARGEDLGWE